jgi:hypothetical protein
MCGAAVWQIPTREINKIIYRNGCVKEVSENIKNGKNKE